MDLRALVQAAGAGEQFPPLKVMAGGALYVGYVGTENQRNEALATGLSQYFYEEENPKRRDDARAVYARAIPKGEAVANRLREAAVPESETFALLNCQVWPATGDGIQAAVVFLPFAAIDSWWIGAAQPVRRRGSAGVFVGGLFPISSE